MKKNKFLFSLTMCLIIFSSIKAQEPGEPIFTEFIQGHYDKHCQALEISAPGNQAINLSDYMIVTYSWNGTGKTLEDMITNSWDVHSRRYVRYVPGYDYAATNPTEFGNNPGIIQPDSEVDSMLQPGEGFVLARAWSWGATENEQIAAEADVIWARNDLSVSGKVLLNEGDSAYDNDNGITPWLGWPPDGCHAIYKILNDSIKKGLKGLGKDPSDYQLVDIMGYVDDNSPWDPAGTELSGQEGHRLVRKSAYYMGDTGQGTNGSWGTSDANSEWEYENLANDDALVANLGSHSFDTVVVTFSADGDWNSDGSGDTSIVKLEGVDITIPSGQSPTCQKVIIKPNASLSIEGSLTINGDLIIESDSNGTGSLIDLGTLTVNGETHVEQYIKADRWFYLSSPIASANSSVFDAVAGTNHLYQWDETTPGWSEITDNSTSLNVMQAYAVKMMGEDTLINFRGSLNDGPVAFNLSASVAGVQDDHRWNLVGNPYPSPIDWYDDAGWTKDNIYNGIYFQQDDQLCIATGGARISTPAECFNGAIASMQGFWVFASGNDNDQLSINDNARINNSDTVSLKSTIQKSIARVSLNGNGLSDEMVISFNSAATNGFDGSLDAYKPQMTNLTTTQKSIIYSYDVEGNALAINSLPVNASVIPLGITVTNAGEYTISVSSFENIDADEIYLIDNVTNTRVNLKEEGYTFTADAGEYNSRFEIQILKSTTSIAAKEKGIKIFSHGNMVYIQSQNITTNSNVRIIDLLGRTVWEGNVDINGTSRINLEQNGYYIINVKTENNQYVEKVIIQ